MTLPNESCLNHSPRVPCAVQVYLIGRSTPETRSFLNKHRTFVSVQLEDIEPGIGLRKIGSAQPSSATNRRVAASIASCYSALQLFKKVSGHIGHGGGNN